MFRTAFVKNLGCLVISAALALALTEIYARFYLPEVVDTFIVALNGVNERYHHPLLPRTQDSEPDRHAFRILFLGDSFTFGFAPPGHTFPEQTVQFLRSDVSSESRKVQGLNMGNPSYSPTIHSVIVRDVVPSFDPDLVVLALDDSDPQDDFLYAPLARWDTEGLAESVLPGLPGVPESLQFVARRLKSVRILAAALQEKFGTLRWPQGAEADRYLLRGKNRYGHYRLPLEPVWNSAFDRSLQIVENIRRYLEHRRIPLVIVLYPYPPLAMSNYSNEWLSNYALEQGHMYQSAFHQSVERFAAERNIPIYNFTDIAKDADSPDSLYNPVDGHFSVAGNTLFGKNLAHFLDQRFGSAMTKR